MHISEGVLSIEVAVAGAVLSLPFLVYAYKGLETQDLPKTALMSALFFVGSFIHFPIGVTNIHLVLNGLVGAMLGMRAFLAIFIALILQALLMGYGGVSSLGVNLFMMALPALLSALIFKKAIKFAGVKQKILFFVCGFVSVLFSSLLLALFLALSGEKFLEGAKIAFVASLPLMALEGFITMLALGFIQKSYPEILESK